MDTKNINTNIHFFLEDLTEDKLEDNENMLQELLQEFENQELDVNLNFGTDLSWNNRDIIGLSYFAKKQMYIGNEELYYDEEYTVKELMKICQYYGISKNIKASKCKKSDIISTIIYFENCNENIEAVNNRHKMWAYMTELIKDPKMKQYLLW
jgi:Zn-dependent peptidase ImmA (M78 family)